MKSFKPSHFLKGCVILVSLLLVVLYIINVTSFILPLNSSYNKWEANKPHSYSAVVNYGTYAGVYNSSQEFVRNGVLSSSTSTTFSEPAIDRLFASVRGCAFNPFGFFMCKVEYHPTYGYPTRFIENDFDLGRIIEISEFTPAQ